MKQSIIDDGIDHAQGSVATHLRCDAIFNDYFITRLLLSPIMKFFFENQSTFGKVMGNNRVFCFLTHGLDNLPPVQYFLGQQ